MYNSDHTATECIGQIFFLLPPQSVDVLSRFIYTALWLLFIRSACTEIFYRVRTYFHLTHFSVNYGIFYRNLRGKSFIVMKIKNSRI